MGLRCDALLKARSRLPPEVPGKSEDHERNTGPESKKSEDSKADRIGIRVLGHPKASEHDNYEKRAGSEDQEESTCDEIPRGQNRFR